MLRKAEGRLEAVDNYLVLLQSWQVLEGHAFETSLGCFALQLATGLGTICGRFAIPCTQRVFAHIFAILTARRALDLAYWLSALCLADWTVFACADTLWANDRTSWFPTRHLATICRHACAPCFATWRLTLWFAHLVALLCLALPSALRRTVFGIIWQNAVR